MTQFKMLKTGCHRWCLPWRVAVFLMVFLITGCGDDVEMGSLTTTVYEGDPDIFIMGQSNANHDLAVAIERATGKSVHQISHGGQPIQHWFESPYNWLKMDVTFLGERTFQYFIWFQGENNLGNHQDYEAKLMEIIAAVSPEQMPTVIIVGVWVDDATVTPFREYQRAMCERNEDFYFVDSKGCSRSDGVHLSKAGHQLLAKRISDLIAQIEN